MTPLPIPQGPADVDAEWLSNALSRPGRRVSVRDVVHEAIVPGAGTKLRISLSYDGDPQGLPDLMWVKAGWEEHSPALEAVGTYAKEALFYALIRDVVGVRAPKSYHASWNERGQSVLLLEDLGRRGATLWDCRVARSVEDVATLLDGIARLHAQWWESEALLSMPLIDIPMRSTDPHAAWPRANGAKRLCEMLSGPRGDGLPAHIKDGDRIERAFWRMVDTLEAMPGGCMLHGDPHPGNCFSDADGGAGLYDWQTISRGPWAYDVAYMVTTALAPDIRRANEHMLLDHYLDRLSALGATPPGRGAAWDAYRRHIAYPLLIWPTNHVTHQSEENIRALTYRLGIAADDFGFFDLWKV